MDKVNGMGYADSGAGRSGGDRGGAGEDGSGGVVVVVEDEIWAEDCRVTMGQRLPAGCVDVVLTSPFYNTNMKAKGGRTILDGKRGSNEVARYDKFVDVMGNDEYRAFTVDLFGGYGKVLKENGVVLYNISYGNENSECLWLTVADIIGRTDFTVADVIVWKKRSALPACLSPNKLTRITEFVFVFCRKGEYKTFYANKRNVSVRGTGQKMYENIFNFIEAANNDGPCNLNGATFSTELCTRLLSIYAPPQRGCVRQLHGDGNDSGSSKADGAALYWLGNIGSAVRVCKEADCGGLL